jgi:NAD(P)H-hydrate repair Nnr-like enzyme with NAD(P)H-hydrate dehydratase domain
MVHPYMRQSNQAYSDVQNSGDVIKRILEMMDRLHAIVIGPGLGRDKLMQESARGILEEAKKRGMGVVLDAVGCELFRYPEPDGEIWADCYVMDRMGFLWFKITQILYTDIRKPC